MKWLLSIFQGAYLSQLQLLPQCYKRSAYMYTRFMPILLSTCNSENEDSSQLFSSNGSHFRNLAEIHCIDNYPQSANFSTTVGITIMNDPEIESLLSSITETESLEDMLVNPRPSFVSQISEGFDSTLLLVAPEFSTSSNQDMYSVWRDLSPYIGEIYFSTKVSDILTDSYGYENNPARDESDLTSYYRSPITNDNSEIDAWLASDDTAAVTKETKIPNIESKNDDGAFSKAFRALLHHISFIPLKNSRLKSTSTATFVLNKANSPVRIPRTMQNEIPLCERDKDEEVIT